MTNTHALSVGDRVRIVVPQDTLKSLYRYDGLVCTVLVPSSQEFLGHTLLAPLTSVPDIKDFYWPYTQLELLPHISSNADLDAHNSYQFKVLMAELYRRRREEYTPGKFGARLGENAAWVIEVETSDEPKISDIRRYAMALGIQIDIKLSPVR